MDRISLRKQLQVGSYLFHFNGTQLVVAPHHNPERIILSLDAEDALDLIDWLIPHRKELFQGVMRDSVEAFKARVRANYGLSEPEERRVFVPPSSCDDTLIALALAGEETLFCDIYRTPLCPNCHNCHHRRCKYFISEKSSHVREDEQGQAHM